MIEIFRPANQLNNDDLPTFGPAHDHDLGEWHLDHPLMIDWRRHCAGEAGMIRYDGNRDRPTDLPGQLDACGVSATTQETASAGQSSRIIRPREPHGKSAGLARTMKDSITPVTMLVSNNA